MNYTKFSYLAMIYSDKKERKYSLNAIIRIWRKIMARGINTKCLHLEEEEGCCKQLWLYQFPIYQTATYEHPAVGQSTALTTADCRTRPESIWRRWLHPLRMAWTRWHFPAVWRYYHADGAVCAGRPSHYWFRSLLEAAFVFFDHVSTKNGICFSRIDCAKEDVEAFCSGKYKGYLCGDPDESDDECGGHCRPFCHREAPWPSSHSG